MNNEDIQKCLDIYQEELNKNIFKSLISLYVNMRLS